jgi:hypothetical protein
LGSNYTLLFSFAKARWSRKRRKAGGCQGYRDAAALEHEIDLLVYMFYVLTPEEIAIVEGNSP